MLLLLDSVNYSHLIILCKRTVNCSGESNACIGTLTFLPSGNGVISPDTVDIFLEIPFLLIGLGFLLFLQLLLSNVFPHPSSSEKLILPQEFLFLLFPSSIQKQTNEQKII